MVRAYFPQSANHNVRVNTNFPPQSGGVDSSAPVGGTMEYENLVSMEYEDQEDMDYEG